MTLQRLDVGVGRVKGVGWSHRKVLGKTEESRKRAEREGEGEIIAATTPHKQMSAAGNKKEEWAKEEREKEEDEEDEEE